MEKLMSIIDAYDQSKPLFTPEDFYGVHEKCGDACILTFSKHVQDKVLSEYTHEIVAQSGTANGKISVYRLIDSGVLFYLSPIDSAVAGTVLHEVHTLTGATKFISFGSCGILDDRCREKIIVPTEAYRDEGFSYHLLPPADYIRVKNAEFVKETLAAMGVETIGGKTWTTDAIYRETVDKIARRKADGCVCVEMECSGLQAMCDYLGCDFFTFFFSGDLLLEKWERGRLGNEVEKSAQIDCFDLAKSIIEKACST